MSDDDPLLCFALHHAPADHYWLTVNGVWVALCAGCCAQWRVSACAEMRPVRITNRRPADELFIANRMTWATASLESHHG